MNVLYAAVNWLFSPDDGAFVMAVRDVIRHDILDHVMSQHWLVIWMAGFAVKAKLSSPAVPNRTWTSHNEDK